MLKKRIIPTLLIEKQSLIKTINFKKKTYIGDPLNAIKIFNEKFVDELIILDIHQNQLNNEIDYNFLEDLFGQCFSPVTYGGGITTIKEADKILKLGAEKIYAIDNDDETVGNFKYNQKINNTSIELNIMDCFDIVDFNYDVLLANINKTVLIRLIPKITSKDNLMIISGILSKDYYDI